MIVWHRFKGAEEKHLQVPNNQAEFTIEQPWSEGGAVLKQIDGMFQTITLSDARLKLRLKQVFNERNEALMDRLSRYLRVRVPDLREIQAVHGAPGREGLDIY